MMMTRPVKYDTRLVVLCPAELPRAINVAAAARLQRPAEYIRAAILARLQAASRSAHLRLMPVPDDPYTIIGPGQELDELVRMLQEKTPLHQISNMEARTVFELMIQRGFKIAKVTVSARHAHKGGGSISEISQPVVTLGAEVLRKAYCLAPWSVNVWAARSRASLGLVGIDRGSSTKIS